MFWGAKHLPTGIRVVGGLTSSVYAVRKRSPVQRSTFAYRMIEGSTYVIVYVFRHKRLLAAGRWTPPSFCPLQDDAWIAQSLESAGPSDLFQLISLSNKPNPRSCCAIWNGRGSYYSCVFGTTPRNASNCPKGTRFKVQKTKLNRSKSLDIHLQVSFCLSLVANTHWQPNHWTKWVMRNQFIAQDPTICPGPLPTWFMADPLGHEGKNNLQFLWAGMHPRANMSQQSSLPDYFHFVFSISILCTAIVVASG